MKKRSQIVCSLGLAAWAAGVSCAWGDAGVPEVASVTMK